MKRINKFLFLTIICLFAFMPFVYAENEEETKKCDAITLSNLTKEASGVIGTYEFVYDENGQVKGFNYLLFNIPDNLYASYVNFELSQDQMNDETVNETEKVKKVEIDPDSGIGKVFDSNIEDSYIVTFYIRSNDSVCLSTLKTINIKKPRFNPISEDEECNHYEVQDYIYCQQWVTQDFPMNYAEIIERIKSKKESVKGKTTAACVYCEENAKNNKIYNTILQIRKYAIYGVILGIVIDIFVIIFLMKRIKENRIL